jgi:hypothetical protein
MLLSILICYLIIVLPYGITLPLSAVIGIPFKANVWDPLFIVFDFLALTNSLIAFVLMITMSQQFRQKLCETFKRKMPFVWRACMSLKQTDSIITSPITSSTGNPILLTPTIS